MNRQNWPYLKFLDSPLPCSQQLSFPTHKSVEVLRFEAQQEWEKALDYSTNHWHPDVGVSSHAPQLSPVAWNALNVAGGLSHLFNCSRDELQWARKRFSASVGGSAR